MTRAVFRLRQPRVFRVWFRTARKTLSTGLGVQICVQCSAGMSVKANSSFMSGVNCGGGADQVGGQTGDGGGGTHQKGFIKTI